MYAALIGSYSTLRTAPHNRIVLGRAEALHSPGNLWKAGSPHARPSSAGIAAVSARLSPMDLKFALRSLRKNAGFTLLAVLVMGLGIGANTAMFSVVNSVLLKPLDYRDPDRIVTLSSLSKTRGSHYQVSGPDFHDWHDQSTAFSEMGRYDNDDETAIQTRSGAEYGSTAEVTPEFFRVFEVEPAIGRLFRPEESQTGSAGAVTISYSYWQSHFGADPGVLGQTLRMAGRTFPIVGVLPPRFHFPGKTDIWMPANTVFPENTSRSAGNYRVVARLKPEVTLEQAQSQMSAIGMRLEQLYPATNRNRGVAVTGMRDEIVGDVRTTLYLLLGAVSLVLLIACANMANLLLAKATSRTREMAIRAAMGASRGRIVRQLITESMVLAVASGIAGLLLAIWGSSALVAIAPQDVPRLAETRIDGWVLAFTFGVSVLASLLFGLAPAIQASRVDLNDSLKQGTARSVGGGAGRIRAGLVVAEIALSVVLLTGAGLLMKSFVAMHNVTLGFHPENVLVMGANVPASDLESQRRAARFYRDLATDIAALPGVSAAGITWSPPGHVGSWGGYWIDHPPAGELSVSAPQAVFSLMAPGTFATLGIPLRRGRDFNDGDGYDAPFTAVINDALAREAFAGQDPIGRSILCGFDRESMKGMKIVGVVGDIRQDGPARPPRPEIIMAYQQHPGRAGSMNFVVRTAADPTTLVETIRRKTRAASPEVPVKFTTLETLLADDVAAPRFRTLLLGIFAGLAVCLAMAGVYGVMAYVVGQRANEIGLRMALGASPGKVMRLVLGQGLALAAIGLAIGLTGSVAATRLLTKMLFEVKPSDPMTYAGVVIVLAVVALAASYIPARRATQVDPLVALRQE
jgi:putative ABC transport system permease protein